MIKNCTNSNIVTHAIAGREAISSTGNFSTESNPTYWGFLSGCLTRRMVDNLRELARQNRISQVIMSYTTVIAFKLDGQWIRIDDTHSITTSSKHETHLYRLPNAEFCPKDASIEELEAIVEGRTQYLRGYGRKLGTYRARIAA